MILCGESYKSCICLCTEKTNLYHFLLRESGQTVAFPCCRTDLQWLSAFALSLVYYFAMCVEPFQRPNSIGLSVAYLAASCFAVVSPCHVVISQFVTILAMRIEASIARMVFAYSLIMATLLYHIRTVIGIRSKLEVGSSHAPWRIAQVHHDQAFGDRTMSDFPRDTVCEECAFPRGKSAISIGENRPLPQPATISCRRGNMLPESFLNGCSAVLMSFEEASSRFANRRATTTFTELWGVVRGIIGVHKKLPFLCPSQGRFTVVAWCFCVLYSFYSSTSERIMQSITRVETISEAEAAGWVRAGN